VAVAQLAFDKAELARDKIKLALEAVTTPAAKQAITVELEAAEKAVEDCKSDLHRAGLRLRALELAEREKTIALEEAKIIQNGELAKSTSSDKSSAGIRPGESGDPDTVAIPEFKISNQLKRLLKEAESGDADAQYRVGDAYDNGLGAGAMGGIWSMKWYQKAASQGHVGAARGIGWLHYQGNGVPKDFLVAAEWFSRCADKRDESCRMGLSFLSESGEGRVSRDVSRAKEMQQELAESLQKRARTGDEAAAFLAGVLLDHQKEPGKAAEWYRMGAQLEHVPSLLMIAVSLQKQMKLEEASRHYRKASELGSSVALHQLAYLAEQRKDFEEAVLLYTQAIEMGNPGSMANLGWLTWRGQGVPRDRRNPAPWFRLGAALGNPHAQYSLATWWRYFNDKNPDVWVDKFLSEPRVEFWYRKAAELGNVQAMSELAYVIHAKYAIGTKDEGFLPALQESLRWAERARGAGYKDGDKLVQSIRIRFGEQLPTK